MGSDGSACVQWLMKLSPERVCVDFFLLYLLVKEKLARLLTVRQSLLRACRISHALRPTS